MRIPVAIGVEVGGTKIAAATVDLNRGSVLNRREIMTRREQGGARVLDRLHALVRDIYPQGMDTDLCIGPAGNRIRH